ncbi:MAG: hypothetical protein AB1782_01990 [Cyanobacteriota bacterium]
MKTKSRIIRNSLITITLISFFICIAYYLSNNHVITSLIFGSNEYSLNGKSIINQRYNKAIEGSVLDNIYSVKATLISFKEPKILHKKLNLTENFINSNITDNFNVNSNNFNENNYYLNSNKLTDKTFSISKNSYRSLIIDLNKKSNNEIAENNYDHIYTIQATRKNNRFEGLVDNFSNDNSNSKSILISSISNWDKSKSKKFYKIGNPLNFKEDADRLSVINNDNNRNILSLNNKILKQSKNKSKLHLDIVRDFSSDPLNSIIQNVLIPSGLPETAANVDAITKGMGLPSGALENSYSLAGSLGITVEELSNPNTKLSSNIVMSINSNKNYIGKELDLNNTTLADYYRQALRNDSLEQIKTDN